MRCHFVGVVWEMNRAVLQTNPNQQRDRRRAGGAWVRLIPQIRPRGAPEGWTAQQNPAAKSEACWERVCPSVTIITITFFEVERLLASRSHACCLCPPVIISSTCFLFWYFLCTNHQTQRSEVKPWDFLLSDIRLIHWKDPTLLL